MESRLNLLEVHLAVRKAELDEQETADYSAFIDHFPKAIFFANTREALDDFQKDQRIKLPAWFLTYRETLAEAYAGADDLAVQFSSFTGRFHVGSPSVPDSFEKRCAGS